MSQSQPDREYLLRVIGPPLRQLILNHYKPDSCIASSRIGMDLLERLEIPSYPLAVELTVFNAAFVKHVEHEGRLPDSKEEVERWFIEDGAHSVGTGVPLDDGHPGRHMVLVVENSYVWDLSADQASRPEKGIVINQPLIGPIRPGFLEAQGSLFAQDGQGAVAIYRARPGYDCWTISPNWDANGGDAPVRAAIVAAAFEGIAQALTDAIP